MFRTSRNTRTRIRRVTTAFRENRDIVAVAVTVAEQTGGGGDERHQSDGLVSTRRLSARRETTIAPLGGGGGPRSLAALSLSLSPNIFLSLNLSFAISLSKFVSLQISLSISISLSLSRSKGGGGEEAGGDREPARGAAQELRRHGRGRAPRRRRPRRQRPLPGTCLNKHATHANLHASAPSDRASDTDALRSIASRATAPTQRAVGRKGAASLPPGALVPWSLEP